MEVSKNKNDIVQNENFIPKAQEKDDVVVKKVWTLQDILRENEKRMEDMSDNFNPLSGYRSIGERKCVKIDDFPIKVQYLPVEMMDEGLVKDLAKYGLRQMACYFATNRTISKKNGVPFEPTQMVVDTIIDMFFRIRYKYDFAFWCWREAKIHPKGSGDDIPFRLNRAQRRLIERYEEQRKAGKPIRLILLKARQWGGSTATQIYMAWLQLIVLKGANSIIVGHVKDSSTEVKDMLTKLLDAYNIELVCDTDSPFMEEEADKLAKRGLYHGTTSSANIFYIPSRNSKFKLGTAEKPNSARGGDSTLAHCTEVGLWVATDGKTPEDIVTSVTGGISYKPNTMIVYESTAKGTGNFFHKIYTSTKKAKLTGKFHQFDYMFVNWYEIGWKNMLPFHDDFKYLKPITLARIGLTMEEAQQKVPWFDFYLPEFIVEDAPCIDDFASELLRLKDQRDAPDEFHEPGAYLWYLWESGATLQAIYWYVCERTKYHDHGDMASETPSNDVEAFKHSGSKVFSEYHIEQFRNGCKEPKMKGDVITTDAEALRSGLRPGKSILNKLKFVNDEQGNLSIWRLPDSVTGINEGYAMKHQYLTVVDIGGVSERADFSVITVFDRSWMVEKGGKPEVVAQWYGHVHHDLLAWKSVQIAKYYDNSLLVIESNTLETRDRDRDVDGDASDFILNQIKECYDNLYERTADNENIVEGAPHKYGFHTNTKTKTTIILNLQHVIREKLYIERDANVLHEYEVYEKKPNGAFGAITGEHDDLLMTRAIGLYICYCEMPLPYTYKLINENDSNVILGSSSSAAIF